MKNFKEKVLDIVRRIPKGKTMTYKEVANLAGSPRGSRVVGNIMKSNFLKDVPCHRVIRSDGKLGGYNRGGQSAKKRILEKEGYKFI